MTQTDTFDGRCDTFDVRCGTGHHLLDGRNMVIEVRHYSVSVEQGRRQQQQNDAVAPRMPACGNREHMKRGRTLNCFTFLKLTGVVGGHRVRTLLLVELEDEECRG